MAKQSEKVIGIDLGTTNSVVAVFEGGKPVVINSPEGGRTTPSVVAFTEGGERLVGQAAKRQAIVNPGRTVTSIKRFMGRRHEEVGAEEKQVSFELSGGAKEPVKVKIDDEEFTPPEISAMVLQYLKGAAEDLPLLPWLRDYIWPLEAAHDPSSIQASAARISRRKTIRSPSQPAIPA